MGKRQCKVRFRVKIMTCFCRAELFFDSSSAISTSRKKCSGSVSDPIASIALQICMPYILNNGSNSFHDATLRKKRETHDTIKTLNNLYLSPPFKISVMKLGTLFQALPISDRHRRPSSRVRIWVKAKCYRV